MVSATRDIARWPKWIVWAGFLLTVAPHLRISSASSRIYHPDGRPDETARRFRAGRPRNGRYAGLTGEGCPSGRTAGDGGISA